MINPKRELFKWGPIDGKVIYVDYFMVPMRLFEKHLKPNWPDCIAYIKKDKIVCIVDRKELYNNGEAIFRKYVLNEKELKKHHEQWFVIVNKFVALQNKITSEKLKTITTNQLKQQFFKWHKLHLDFWVHGFLPELANWGGEQLLRNKLLEKHEKNFIKLFERLSAPEDLSFFQKEELELLKLRLIKDKKVLERRLKQHQQRYFWLHNNYAGSKVLGVAYFRNRLSKISRKEAEEKIRHIEEIPRKVLKSKTKIIKEHKLSGEIANIAKKLSYCIWWQDYRKQYIFMANHYIDVFFREISKRYNIKFKDLCYYSVPDITRLLNKGTKVKNITERYDGFVSYYLHGKGMRYYSGKKANKLIKPYLEVKVDKEINEIKGLVVSRGKVIGKVKIIKTPKKISKMEKGDILVASMTSPDFILVIKKAAAIVTDEGGMTCHAAIVSRELGIPCIVGTKFATKVLKDGMLIEVDAEKGVVRIIK